MNKKEVLIMKLKYYVLLAILAFGIYSPSAIAQMRSGENWRSTETKTVTLFSRAKYKDEFEGYGKSAFNFEHNVRSDVGLKITRNNYDILFGNFTAREGKNQSSDFFTVTMVGGDRSRINDLGELNWSENFDIPFLDTSVEHQPVRHPSKTETVEESSNGQITKVVVGHIYVLHVKDSKSDFYTLFRVEKLTPGDEVTISWKVVPSPETITAVK